MLTADCFHETGKHGAGGLGERKMVGLYQASLEPRDRSSSSEVIHRVEACRHLNNLRDNLVLEFKMSNFMLRSSRLVFQRFPSNSISNWPKNGLRRGLATEASGDTLNLPLAGIKVLDMTRVLAGVSFQKL